MGKSLFGYQNRVTSGTLFVRAAEPGFPISNLKSPMGDANSSWRTPSGVLTSYEGASFTVDGQAVGGARWRAFLLARTNLTPSARVRWVVGAPIATIPETPTIRLKFDDAYVPPATGTYSWSRATEAWKRGADGTWSAVASGLPAVHYLPNGVRVGSLLCRAVTNLIRNARVEGGTVGTPGTAPTNMLIAAGSGLSWAITQVGTTEDGLPMFGLRFYGTASGGTNCIVYFDTLTGMPVVDGDNVGYALHARQIAGSQSNITECRMGYTAPDAGGTLVPGAGGFRVIAVNELRLGDQRHEFTYTAGGGATVAYNRPYFQVIVTAAGAVDVTFALGGMILHKGLNSGFMAPFPVFPPVSSPGSSTRNADNLTYTPVTTPMNVNAMTWFISAAMMTGTSNTGITYKIDDTTANNRVVWRPRASGGLPDEDWTVASGGSTVVDTTLKFWGVPMKTLSRHVATMGPTGFKAWTPDGSTVTDSDTVTDLTRLSMDATNSPACLAVDEIRVYRKRLTDNQCLSLITDGTTYDMAYSSYDSGYITMGGDGLQEQLLHIAPADITTSRYARCDIEDPTNPEGFIRVALAFVGPCWVPEVGVSWQSGYAPESSEEIFLTKGGQQHFTRLFRRRGWDVMMDAMTGSEHWATQQLLDAVAASGANVLFVPDYDSAYLNQEAVFGLLKSQTPVGFAGRSTAFRSWRASITERL